MGKNGGVGSPEFTKEYEVRLKEHLSAIQKKAKANTLQDSRFGDRWINPMEFIFQTILDYTIRLQGITHQDLVNESMWDTKTVRKNVNMLINEGRVVRVKSKYVAALDNMKAGLQKEAAQLMSFDRWGAFDLLHPNHKFDIKNNVDLMLLYLTNQIGAFVIHTLIEASNPENPYIESSKFGDKLSASWFQYVICSDIQDLLERFRQIMLWTIHYNEGKGIKQYSSSNYKIGMEDILRLRRSLRGIFPELTKYFDNKRDLIPKKLENHVDSTIDANHSQMKYEIQKKCKHEYIKLARNEELGRTMFECIKCKITKKGKRLSM